MSRIYTYDDIVIKVQKSQTAYEEDIDNDIFAVHGFLLNKKIFIIHDMNEFTQMMADFNAMIESDVITSKIKARATKQLKFIKKHVCFYSGVDQHISSGDGLCSVLKKVCAKTKKPHVIASNKIMPSSSSDIKIVDKVIVYVSYLSTGAYKFKPHNIMYASDNPLIAESINLSTDLSLKEFNCSRLIVSQEDIKKHYAKNPKDASNLMIIECNLFSMN